MATIAHLSDLHLIEADHERRGTRGRMRLRYLSLGRELAAEARVERLRAALVQYRQSRACHLVVTGDLTEDGTEAQFELFAAVLAQSGIDPREVTLTPGNHDVYADPAGFQRALEGPLKPFARTSQAGAVTMIDGIALLPLCTAIAQSVARSAGLLAREQLAFIAQAAAELRQSRCAVVLAQHHPPHRHRGRVLHWFDGLQNAAEVTSLLARHVELHVLHGHWHRASSLPALREGRVRVFGASACVEAADPLRFYEAVDGYLSPIETPRRPDPVVSTPAPRVVPA